MELPAQTAAGKVLWHFSMSLDGFVAGPGDSLDFLDGVTAARPGIVEEYVATTGAVLGGRRGWDAYPDPKAVYGGLWDGPLFVLTHHPDDAVAAEGVTFLDCDLGEAVRIAKDAADGKNVEVLSASVGTQLLQAGLLDEIHLHLVPVLLGDGVRLYDVPGGSPVALRHLVGDEPRVEVDLRLAPVR